MLKRCKVCGETAEELIFPQDIFRCSSCRVLFRGRAVSPNFYSDNHYWYQGDEELKLHQEARWVWFKKHLLPGNTVEFGAADGDFLALVRQELPQYSIVYSELEYRQRPEYDVLDFLARIGPMESFESSLQFSNVFMIDTIEHLNDLDVAFNKVRQLLVPGGRFFFSTNDGDVFDTFLQIFYHQEHTYMLTKQAISILADRHGFRVFQYFRAPQSWLFVILEKEA